jgi:hypothetical protein
MSKARWMAIFFGGTFAVVGVVLFATSFSLDARADQLSRPPGPGEVRGTAVVVGDNQMRSLHFHVPCVACKTQVSRTLEKKKNERTTNTIFNQTQGKDPVQLSFEGKTVYLPLQLWIAESPTRQESTSIRPSFVPHGSEVGQVSYAVSESILQKDQQVFLAASLSPGTQSLAADPALKVAGVLVFAGSQQQCLETLRSSAKVQRLMGVVFGGIGLVVFGLLWKVFGQTKP